MEDSEVLQRPKYWGIARDQVTPEIIEDVLRIYYLCGMGEDYQFKPSFEQDALEVYDDCLADDEWLRYGQEWRFGSKITPHSKFRIWKADDDLIRFSFDPNWDPDLDGGEMTDTEIDAIVEEFKTKTESYLFGIGLAQPIYR